MNRKYTGPAKPIPLDLEQHSPWERIERLVFLICLIVIACDLIFTHP